jgi:hypothetical protein
MYIGEYKVPYLLLVCNALATVIPPRGLVGIMTSGHERIVWYTLSA